MPDQPLSPARRAVAMASLILAGEAIFIPTFHPGRYFRTSLLEAFGVTELQLGEAQAWYGVAAMVCYGLGGPLADRFGARPLMTLSLLATGAGSLYMATLPSLLGLKCLFAFWGASTILAFWCPLIRATRELGGDLSQGRAFGVLDSGRGAVAWLVAAVSAWSLSGIIAAETNDTESAVRGLMTGYALFSAAVAAVVWFGLPRMKPTPGEDGPRLTTRTVLRLLREPAVWLQAVVVLVAYCAYKSFDFYGHYCEDVYGLDKAQAATFTAWLTFLRVGGALAAGLVADRWLGPARTVAVGFLGLAVAFLGLFAAPQWGGTLGVAIANLAVAWTASCALRGVYFACLHEANIPRTLTGSAAGVVSLVGFTPDIFWPVFAGGLITGAREAGDVAAGYERLWLTLTVLAAVGLVSALLLRKRSKRAG